MKKNDVLSIPANHPDCFRVCVGHKVRGYFERGGDSFLILDNGRALVFHHGNGSYWIAGAKDVARELEIVAERLRKDHDALRNVLSLAGVADQPRRSAR